MKGTTIIAIISVGAVLLWASLVTGEQWYGGVRGGFGSRGGRGWIQFRGHVLCSGCTLKAERAAPPAHLCQLNHRRGQVVMQITSGDVALPYHHLWLKGEDQLFEALTAEENLFKDVEISGLMREYRPTYGILDLLTVHVLG